MGRYAARWSLEVTNHNASRQLGFGQPQGWTKQAVRPMRPWYIGKAQASFADMAATLRRQSVRAEVLSLGLHGSGRRKVVKRLIHVVSQAA